MLILIAVLMLSAAPSPFDHAKPEAVVKAAEEYLAMLQAKCPDDPASCTQKFQLGSIDDLERAKIGEPWAAFVLTDDDFRDTEFQNLLKVARFNYFASPIIIDGEFKGIVRVCEDPDEPGTEWTSCGSRGPTRMAEVNTYNLTLAPESDSLSVICVLTVQNNSRYILVRQGTDYFAIVASDQAAELIQVMTWHVTRMTMFPLSEVLYKVSVNITEVDRSPR